VCLCIEFAWSSFHSEVFSSYYLIISIISAMFFLSSVNTYINSASIVIFLLVISNLRCGRYNSVYIIVSSCLCYHRYIIVSCCLCYHRYIIVSCCLCYHRYIIVSCLCYHRYIIVSSCLCLRCGRYNSVCMFFHLSIYSPNKQSTCALYKCSIAN
jgi:hypothetical protein